MATRYKSPVRTIEIEGEDGEAKVYSLALTLDAIAKLQEVWGIDSFDELQKRLDKPSPQNLKDVIYACMSATKPETTVEDANVFCRLIGVQDLMTLVNSIIAAGSPPPEVGQADPQTAASKRKNPSR